MSGWSDKSLLEKMQAAVDDMAKEGTGGAPMRGFKFGGKKEEEGLTREKIEAVKVEDKEYERLAMSKEGLDRIRPMIEGIFEVIIGAHERAKGKTDAPIEVPETLRRVQEYVVGIMGRDGATPAEVAAEIGASLSTALAIVNVAIATLQVKEKVKPELEQASMEFVNVTANLRVCDQAKALHGHMHSTVDRVTKAMKVSQDDAETPAGFVRLDGKKGKKTVH